MDYNKNSINKFVSDDISKDLQTYIDGNLHLKTFFNYLENNKIEYQVLEKVKNCFLIVRIATLDPKFFMVILNNNEIKNARVNFGNLKYFQTRVGEIEGIDKNAFILLIDPSINSLEEIITKTKYVDFKNISLKKEYQRIKSAEVKISIKKELRKGLPLGVYNEKNKLNDLTGKEWIKFTKSWFIHNPPPRSKLEIEHPAKFPESMIESFINFFTKKGQLVLDPFLGTGSTAIAAKSTSRNCIGFEINKKYAEISKLRLSQKTLNKWLNPDKKVEEIKIYNEDSLELEKIWKRDQLPSVDFCITSPPYWNQLKRNSMRQRERKDQGLDTIYSINKKDIGNIDDYKEFLEVQKEIFDKVYNIVNNKAYLVIITNNVFYNGRLYPLAFDTAISLSQKWVLKDEKIWCQDDKALMPLGINSAWVANRCHQYCLIFRKEQKQ